ncbi:hypothetical protein [Nocardioides nitrophenolicus]|uniref:hypothetical protein n=1 Tax=Nocardioides nitrophenolicus TaxID=60489 RepID=UPI001959DFD1|nr:hypothetical protein [Nocardioides nitrophenolicus]MBM7519373.1 hypothetical protein [Nocardioides nitrophenolicus]
MNARPALPAAVLASVLLLAGCGGDDEPAPRSAPTSTAPTTAPTSTPPGSTPTADPAPATAPVVHEVAEALRTAGSVRVRATLGGGPARELTLDDTTQVARALDSVAVEQLVHVGPEQVDGVATEHYRVTLDPAAALAGVTLPAQLAALLPDSLEAEVWLDAEHRPVKVTAEPGIVLTFDDWGVARTP